MASLPSLRVARLSFAWRLGFLYAALFLVVGCYLPYLPVWLSWRHLDADQSPCFWPPRCSPVQTLQSVLRVSKEAAGRLGALKN